MAPTNLGSVSDSRTSSGHRSPLIGDEDEATGKVAFSELEPLREFEASTPKMLNGARVTICIGGITDKSPTPSMTTANFREHGGGGQAIMTQAMFPRGASVPRLLLMYVWQARHSARTLPMLLFCGGLAGDIE